MGYMRHHGIIVTSYIDELLESAHAIAKDTFKHVSTITPSSVNHYRSFFVPPDGSKEGWEDSDEGDSKRDSFIEWLDTKRYEDGTSSLRWVEVQYGDDGGDSVVTRHSENRPMPVRKE